LRFLSRGALIRKLDEQTADERGSAAVRVGLIAEVEHLPTKRSHEHPTGPRPQSSIS